MLEVRHFLSDELGKHNTSPGLLAVFEPCERPAGKLWTTSECRETFLCANQHRHWASWMFYSTLGEMRGTFGVRVAKIAAEFQPIPITMMTPARRK